MTPPKESKDLEEICDKLGKFDYRLPSGDVAYCLFSTTNVPCQHCGVYIKTVGMYVCNKQAPDYNEQA